MTNLARRNGYAEERREGRDTHETLIQHASWVATHTRRLVTRVV